MAPPIIFGATLKLILEGDILINSDFLVGFIAAFLSGLLAVKTISFMMRRSSLLPFVWYRLALALVLYIYI
jgi:undecaprenyl-diphosphatase